MRIFRLELAKIIQSKIVIGGAIVSLMIAGGIFFIGYFYSQDYAAQRENVEEGFETSTKSFANHIEENYAGPLTDELVSEMVSDYMREYQTYRQKNGYGMDALPFNIFYWDVVSDFVIGGTPKLAEKMNAAVKNGETLTIKDIKLRKVSETGFKNTNRPLQFGNYIPWNYLFQVLSNLFILMNLLVILIVSVIFFDDTSRNINQLLYATRFGRNKMNRSKILVGMTISLTVFMGFNLLNFGLFATMFNVSGGSASIQTDLGLRLFGFPLSWNLWQTYGFILLVQLLGLLFSAAVTLFISAVSKTGMSAFAAALGLFFLPKLLLEVVAKISTEGFLNNLLASFPMNFGDPTKMLNLLSSDGYFTSSFIGNSLILILFMVLAKLALNFITFCRMRNWHFG